MFTGIVETTAAVIERTSERLNVERPAFFDDIRIGSSISVGGVCLTIVAFDDRSMQFDVVPETWSRTNLEDRNPGDRVNLERALRADGRFEGHVVQGHVEGVAEVRSVKSAKGEVFIDVYLPQDHARHTVQKGSIAIDGVSLTIAEKHDCIITIALIPHTLEHTTLGRLTEGDRVNVETDVLMRISEYRTI